MVIVNLYAGSYLCMMPEEAIAKAEREKKDKYPQACLECRRHLTPFFFSADGIPGAEAWAATRRMPLDLRFKLRRDYSEMCRFVQARMALAIVQSNTLILILVQKGQSVS